jgi:hypothetical protein
MDEPVLLTDICPVKLMIQGAATAMVRSACH